MRAGILSLALAFGAVVSAIPAVQAAQELVSRDILQETIDCGRCTNILDICFENGHTQGQEGCKQTCREHVCHRKPECKKCGGEFSQCPRKSRYPN